MFKIYGRRAVNNLRGGGRTEDDRDEDKENKLSGLFGGSSKRARGWSRRNTNSSTSLAGEGEPLSSDDVEEDTDIEVEVGRGRTNRRSHRGEIDDSNLKDEQARLVEKFKEVDEWEMEFEDVTFDDGGGSDPLAR